MRNATPKTQILVLLGLVAIAACASVQSELEQPRNLEVVHQYDRFRDLHTWAAQPYWVDGGPMRGNLPAIMVGAIAQKAGAGAQQPGQSGLWLMFSSNTNDWQFLQSRDVSLLVDGANRILLGNATHDGRVNTAGLVSVSEILTVPITASMLKTIGSGSLVEVQLGGTQFKLRPSSVAALGKLATSADSAGIGR